MVWPADLLPGWQSTNGEALRSLVGIEGELILERECVVLKFVDAVLSAELILRCR